MPKVIKLAPPQWLASLLQSSREITNAPILLSEFVDNLRLENQQPRAELELLSDTTWLLWHTLAEKEIASLSQCEKHAVALLVDAGWLCPSIGGRVGHLTATR